MMSEEKKHRCLGHDYRDRCIYLLTVTTVDRKPLLGRVVGDVYTAHVELSDLGIEVRHHLYALCDRYPQLRLLQYQIMPDHVHVILQVTGRLSKPLGSLFSSWKIACGRAYAITSGAGRVWPAGARTDTQDKAASTGASSFCIDGASLGSGTLASPERQPFRRLFSPGFNDRILTGKGQLQHMMDYVRDNPRRLLIKRQHTPFFTIRRSVQLAGICFDAVGNMGLLERPLMAVHCRCRWSEQEKRNYAAQCLTAAQQGAVLIGAFISPVEQDIARNAHEQRLPIIHLVENGFNELYKPVGQDFYACAEGRLLQLAPWPYHKDKRAITRQQCQELNRMAEAIAAFYANRRASICAT